MSPNPEVDDRNVSLIGGRKSGFIQISPSKVGPWTTVRLNYAAPAACWRLGNDVVASEVVVKDGNRYVNIRSLVSVCNNTEFVLDLCLVLKASNQKTRSLNDLSKPADSQIDSERIQIDESFEIENYNPTLGWVGIQPIQDHAKGGSSHEVSYLCLLISQTVIKEYVLVIDVLIYCILELLLVSMERSLEIILLYLSFVGKRCLIITELFILVM